MEETTEPNGMLSPGLGDAEGMGPTGNRAPSPGGSLASEDLEMFVLDFEDCVPWQPGGQLSPLAGAAACK